MRLIERVKNSGVVGAGGAGFPTHVKLVARAEWFIANGAECEPLIHKDRELMVHFADEIVQGLKLAATAVTATKVAVGIKEKNRVALYALRDITRKYGIGLAEFGDYYPAGDEYELVYGITGRLIPPQGIPLAIGIIVNNVETLYNVYQASKGIPVTQKFLTIAGLVSQPITVRVPVGMLIKDVLELAGGPTISSFAVLESGLLMGQLVKDLHQPITKTTAGLIVLPTLHNLVQRYQMPAKSMTRIGHSACDQCTYCTELCPRYLLGYDVQPHLVMRSLGFSAMGKEIWNKHALLCCQCGICTLYACPEALYPREACIHGKAELQSIGKSKWQGPKEVKVHPLKDARRVPLNLLMKHLGVSQYESPAGFIETTIQPTLVHIPLKQHVGLSAVPVVKTGAMVQKGHLIGDIPDGQLGAKIHASIDGRIQKITDNMIVIERTG